VNGPDFAKTIPTLVRHWRNIIFRNQPELASGSRSKKFQTANSYG